MQQRVSGRKPAGTVPVILLLSASLVLAGCAAGSTTTPAAPAAGVAKSGALTAGAQIGTMPIAPTGWSPPGKITPLDPLPGTFQSVGDAPAQPGGKVRVFFLGAQWCAYCAAERWAVVTALQKFGTLSGWGKQQHTQGLQDFNLVPTLDLRNVTYNSAFVNFSDKEAQNHDKQALDKFAADEQEIINRFNPEGKWPFVYVNGQYLRIGRGVPPSVIDGRSFDDVYHELMSGAPTEATNAINSEAADITKLICSASGGQPEAVCR